MFHSTGILTWECTKRISKYQLNEEYSRLLEDFLASRDFHENTKWDFAWAVRRYLSFYFWHEKKYLYQVLSFFFL